MKSYLSLIPISARIKKKQNKMTIICIILAVFLVTAIFSMADMELRSQKIRAISDYGNWHITLKNISENDAEQISARDDVKVSSWYASLNYRLKDDYYIGTKRTAICGIEEPVITDILSDGITEGKYPKNNNEIMLTENAKDSLNINLGDSVSLKTPRSEEIFTVSGFSASTAMTNKADAVVALMPLDTYSHFYSEATETALEDSDKVYYVQFKERCNIKKAIAQIQKQYSLTDEQISKNSALLGIMGFSTDSYMLGLYLMAVVLFFLVLVAGILMISSSMNSNVAQRTKFFGMLRCTGASTKQIIRFVRLEALNWCKTAIPTGVLGGIIITWILCSILRFLGGRYFSDMPVFAISGGGIAAGICVGILTVLLAAQSPAKKAAKVSPLTAVSGNAVSSNISRRSLTAGFMKIDTSLGISHAVKSRKNFILMVSSFALSITLFLAFSSFIAFMNHAITPLKPYTPDLSIVCDDNSCSIDRSLAEKISSMSGVKRVYGRSFAYDIPAECDGKLKTVTLISYESNQFNWIDEENWSEDNIGLEKAVKDTDEGYVIAAYHPEIAINKGDKIQTGLGVLMVTDVVSQIPFNRKDGEEILVCSEALFKTLTGNNNYTIIDIQLERGVTEEEVNAIRSLSEGFLFSDQRISNRETKGAYYSFALFVYGFLAVIAMIAIFNIMNSISMSVSAHIRQYGAMRAIGMSIRQLIKMITAEAVTYAVCGSAVGCIIGLPVHYLLFNNLVTARWGDTWTIPSSSLTIIILLVVLSSVAAVYAPSKRIQNMSVTDTIHAQ